jgi:hypothetical protein
MATPSSKGPDQRNRPTSQLKQLESKLEMIAQAISAKTTQEACAASMADTPLGTPMRETQQSEDGSAAQSLYPQRMSDKVLSEISATSGQESVPQTIAIEEDEMLLERYKRLMSPNMPWLIISPGMTASYLASSEPLLMHAIRVVVYFHDSARQQVMAKELMRDISERLLINGEKSLEILQGILVFSNWYNPHLYSHQHSTNLLHLAIALTTDLNIDRGPGTCEKAQMETAMRSYGVARAAKVITNEERRAVLGTYYLTSLTFTSFRKVECLRWTPWLADCADALSEDKEYESDIHLVHLVRMQRIMQESLAPESTTVPCQFYANSFLGDLKRLGTISGYSTIANVLRLQDACTRVSIWQCAFAGLDHKQYGSTELRRRLYGMWRCMEAVKIYMEIYMALPVEEYLVVPFGVFAQFSYTFVVIVRALNLAVDGWDVRTLDEFLDLSDIAERASQRYEAVSGTTLDGIRLNNNAFSNWGLKLRRAKAFHNARFRPAQMAPSLEIIGIEGSNYVRPESEVTMTQYLPLSSDFANNTTLSSFMSLEDLWLSYSDPLQVPMALDLEFGGS